MKLLKKVGIVIISVFLLITVLTIYLMFFPIHAPNNSDHTEKKQVNHVIYPKSTDCNGELCFLTSEENIKESMLVKEHIWYTDTTELFSVEVTQSKNGEIYNHLSVNSDRLEIHGQKNSNEFYSDSENKIYTKGEIDDDLEIWYERRNTDVQEAIISDSKSRVTKYDRTEAEEFMQRQLSKYNYTLKESYQIGYESYLIYTADTTKTNGTSHSNIQSSITIRRDGIITEFTMIEINHEKYRPQIERFSYTYTDKTSTVNRPDWIYDN